LQALLRRANFSADVLASGSPGKRYLKAQKSNPRSVLMLRSLQDEHFFIDVKRGWGSGDIDPLEHELSVFDQLSRSLNVDRLPPRNERGADIVVRADR
jgi:hypothetical protein